LPSGAPQLLSAVARDDPQWRTAMANGGPQLLDAMVSGIPELRAVAASEGLKLFAKVASDAPKLRWAMHTDTGILLRGPNYYFGKTSNKSDRTLEGFMTVVNPFVVDAIHVVHTLALERPDLIRYKFALAIYDNVRNILLQLLFAAFLIEDAMKPKSY